MVKEQSANYHPSPPGLTSRILLFVCDALHDLVQFVQFNKREKHPWRSLTFSKVVG